MPRRAPNSLGLILLLALAVPLVGRCADTLPDALTDREFWALTQQLSEPNGYFVSRSGSTDNLLSNEMQISTIAAAVAKHAAPGGVYLGVGPEQNFTYIAAIRPRIAFITDIRRGNLGVHLLYKALFEMSANRADLVARLFSRRPSPALPARASAAQLMAAVERAAPVDETTFATNLNAVIDLLTNKHGLALLADDRANIEHAYRVYYRFGPAIDYTSSISNRATRFVNYASLMASVDDQGEERGFLANDENFALVKAMESRNLIVPVVGDFAGPRALRAIGAWLKARSATVSTFYVSNVEQYLEQRGAWSAFCANVAALPLDKSSIFIRPNRGGSSFSPMLAETAACTGR